MIAEVLRSMADGIDEENGFAGERPAKARSNRPVRPWFHTEALARHEEDRTVEARAYAGKHPARYAGWQR